MFNLLKKDFILSLKVNIIIIIFICFLSKVGLFSMDNALAVNPIYIFCLVMMVFILMNYCIGYDDKKGIQVILNSLPIKRSDFVKAKYIILVVFILVNSIVFLLFTNIIKVICNNAEGSAINILDIIISIDILLIFYSIYYLLYFRLDDSRRFNSILWMLIMILPNIIVTKFNVPRVENILANVEISNLYRTNIFILIFSIVIYYISFLLSKYIYSKREF